MKLANSTCATRIVRAFIYPVLLFTLVTGFYGCAGAEGESEKQGQLKQVKSNAPVVGGTITGMHQGKTIKLLLETGSITEELIISGNGGFSFTYNFDFYTVAFYQVSIENQPHQQNCSLLNPAGFVTGASISSLQVTCPNFSVVPTDMAIGASFTDTEQALGKIGGLLGISRANSEENISHYVVYFSSGGGVKCSPTPIATIPKTGSDIQYNLSTIDVQCGGNADEFLIYTKNQVGESSLKIHRVFSDAFSLDAAQGVSFSDSDIDKGEIGGTVNITKADDEQNVTHYSLYWGLNSTTRYSTTAIAELVKTGFDLSYEIPADTQVPQGVSHLIVLTKNNTVPGEMTSGVSVPVNDVSPPTEMALQVSLLDTDLDNGQLGGTIQITRAVDESNLTHYVLYWGSNAVTKENATPIATLPKTGSNLQYILAADTAIPAAATHLLVFTKNGVAEMEFSRSTMIHDLPSAPMRGAAGLAFIDHDNDSDEISGTIEIKKAAGESNIDEYVLYWGSGATTKQGATPLATLAKTGADLQYSLAADTVPPAGATHFLVYTKNSLGEIAIPEALAIQDFPLSSISYSAPVGESVFGFNTTISGDTLLTYGDGPSVHVFRRSGASYTHEQKIEAPEADVNNFGITASLDQDTLVVGSNDEAVYVFERSGTTWSYSTKLTAPNGEAGDLFGSSGIQALMAGKRLAVSGDTIVIAAPEEDSSQSFITNGSAAATDNDQEDAGAVYVFRKVSSNWQQEAYIKASNTSSFYNPVYFGWSVDIDGDTIVVGAVTDMLGQTGITNGPFAPITSGGGTAPGAAFVYKRTGSAWVQEAYIRPSSGDANNFGRAVAIDGDLLAISGFHNWTGAPEVARQGYVYLFSRAGGSWAEQGMVQASNAHNFDYFGNSIDLAGGTLVVGAVHEDSNVDGIIYGAGPVYNGSNRNSTYAGAAYLFRYDGNSWQQQAYLKDESSSSNEYFGVSVSTSAGIIAIGTGTGVALFE